MERKSKGTMAYKMKSTAMYNKVELEGDLPVKKPKWYNFAQKIKVKRMNKKSKKKFEQ